MTWTVVGVFWLLVLGVPAVMMINSGHAGAAPRAEELLRRRYALGKIDTEEYRTRLTALRSSAAGAP